MVGGATERYRDRVDAGRQLAKALAPYRDGSDLLVLALPRGGVPVANEVARELGAPLDVFLVRKIGVPGHEETAMGAIATGGVRVINEQLREALDVTDEMLAAAASEEQQELERRDREYRDGRAEPEIEGRTVVLIDDGLATGSTMEAAILAVRQQEPRRVIAAVPVGAAESCERIGQVADEVICLRMPEPFRAVGLWYEDFDQVTDDEVRSLLTAVAHTSLPADADDAATGGP